jgi:hypothetical protein
MVWVQIDDKFPEHPKVLLAGPLAGWLHVCGLCYCNRNLTDGFIPRAAVKTLADFEYIHVEVGSVPGLFAIDDDVTCLGLAAHLVVIGIWEEVPGGYKVHDFGDYQQSKAEVLAKREATRKRVEEYRSRKADGNSDVTTLHESYNGVSNAVSNSDVTPPLIPKPKPSPKPSTQPTEDEHTARSAPVRVSYPDDFELFWKEYPSGNGSKKSAYEQWRKLKPDEDLRLEIMHGLSLWNRSDRWQRGYVKDSARWLRDQLWSNPPADQPRASPNGQHISPQERKRQRLLAIANGEVTL